MAKKSTGRRAPRQPQYRVSFNLTAANAASVAKKLRDALGVDISLSVQKIERNPSRADRLSEIEATVADAVQEVGSLREEMEEWHGNIPENLQSGEKAEQVQSAIDALQQIENDLEGVDFSSVEFPGMM